MASKQAIEEQPLLQKKDKLNAGVVVGQYEYDS